MKTIMLRRLAVLLVVVAGGARPLLACTVDAECDDGDTCSLADAGQAGVCVPGGGGDGDADGICDVDDNCPAVANASQQDIDGYGMGDACDAEDVDLNLVLAKLKRSINIVRPNGSIIVQGDFLRLSPELPLTTSGGFHVRVEDQIALDFNLAFQTSECVANAKQRIMCKNASKTSQLVLKPVSGANQEDYRFTAKFSKLPLTGPFFMPVRLTITNAPATLVEGIDRIGTILDCRQTTLGMTCKQ